jgi:hypothetical protein
MDDRLRAKLDRNRREIARQRTLRWTCRWVIVVGGLLFCSAFAFVGKSGISGQIAGITVCLSGPPVLIAGATLFWLGGLAIGRKSVLSTMTDREKRIVND